MALLFKLLLFFTSSTFIAQNITVQVIDAASTSPIPFANIKTGENAGTISNAEGFFTLSSSDDTKTITISCIGYNSKSLTIQDIKRLQNIITLKEAINQLDEVFISTTAPSADTIIARVNAKIKSNYNINLQTFSAFKRSTEIVRFKDLEFEIDKASNVNRKQLEAVNTNVMQLINQVKNSSFTEFNDFKGKIFSLNKDSIKLGIEKATELLDYDNNFSVDNMQNRMQHIILQYLDTTKTYKLKSGVFKIEDSLALNDKRLTENNKNDVSTLNKTTKLVLKHAQFYDNSFLTTLLNTTIYTYHIDDVRFNNNTLTYIIAFKPKKAKAKYSGKLYISDKDYGITKIDYSYYKNRRGQKFNLRLLLGVKYIENVSKGTIIFEKDSAMFYQPKYINRTYGSYFYVSRPLKFIENSTKKHKIAFEFTMEGDNLIKEELLITAHQKLEPTNFKDYQQLTKIPITKLNRFDNTMWDTEGVIEPSLKMKAFKPKN